MSHLDALQARHHRALYELRAAVASVKGQPFDAELLWRVASMLELVELELRYDVSLAVVLLGDADEVDA